MDKSQIYLPQVDENKKQINPNEACSSEAKSFLTTYATTYMNKLFPTSYCQPSSHSPTISSYFLYDSKEKKCGILVDSLHKNRNVDYCSDEINLYRAYTLWYNEESVGNEYVKDLIVEDDLANKLSNISNQKVILITNQSSDKEYGYNLISRYLQGKKVNVLSKETDKYLTSSILSNYSSYTYSGDIPSVSTLKSAIES